MIYLYSGTPGSGKSLHMAQDILFKLRKKHNVIANFMIDEEIVKKRLFGKKEIGLFTYLDNEDLNVSALVEYARKYHIMGKENQTLLCIDECHVLFNPREFQRKDRLNWIQFFTQHRKLGFNIILVTQNDRLLDRQIRGLIEYEVKHRKVNNFKIGKVLPLKTFIAIENWYGVREKIGSTFFVYKKQLGKLYDSYKMFDDSIMDSAVIVKK